MAEEFNKPLINIEPFKNFKQNYLCDVDTENSITSNIADFANTTVSNFKNSPNPISDLESSKNANLLSLCSVIEDEVVQLRKIEEQKEFLLEALKRSESEKAELLNKCANFETELFNKDIKIRDYELKIRMNKDESKIEPTRISNSNCISTLRASITKLQAENKKLHSIVKNNYIVKEKIDHDQNYISRLENQIKEYKSYVDTERDKLKHELEILKSALKLHENDSIVLKNEYSHMKDTFDTLTSNLKVSEQDNLQKDSQIDILTNELTSCKKKLNELEALKNRAIFSRDSYKKILASYDNLKVDETYPDKSLTERCEQLESFVAELDEQCRNLEVSNSMLRFSVNEENKNISKNYICQRCLHSNIQTQTLSSEDQKMERVLHLKINPHEIHELTVTKQLEESIIQNNALHSIIDSLKEEINQKTYFKDLKQFNLIMQRIGKLPTTSKYLDMIEESTKNKKLAARIRQACTDKIHSLRGDFSKLLGCGVEYDLKDNTVRLISVYSDKPEDHLLFKKNNETKNFELLQNQFSRSMQHLVANYKEIPALASAVNLELYKMSNRIS